MIVQDSDLPFKSTLLDVLNVSPAKVPHFNKLVISQLENEIPRGDLPLVFRYLRDTIWLMTREMYDLATVSMIIIVENSLKKKLLSLNENISDADRKKIEWDTLHWTNEKLKNNISVNCYNKIKDMNQIRGEILHNNMYSGEKKVDTKVLEAINRNNPLPKVRHELVRMYLEIGREYGLEGTVELLKDCLFVLRELEPETIASGNRLDLTIQFYRSLRESQNEEDCHDYKK